MAEKLDDPVLHSRALGALARVLDGRGQLREHAQIARRRLELTRGAHNADPAECIDALTGIGMALMYVGEYVPAMLHIEQAIRSAESVRAIGQQVAALGLKQHCLFRLDRWDEMLAVEQEWRALEAHYARARVGVTCFAVALSASIQARRGEQERAKQLADESYDYMVGFTGSPDKWQRNQFF
jgi:hypothetical protein